MIAIRSAAWAADVTSPASATPATAAGSENLLELVIDPSFPSLSGSASGAGETVALRRRAGRPSRASEARRFGPDRPESPGGAPRPSRGGRTGTPPDRQACARPPSSGRGRTRGPFRLGRSGTRVVPCADSLPWVGARAAPGAATRASPSKATPSLGFLARSLYQLI